MHISGYSKSLNLGHPHLASLWDGEVVAQEKYDGSQISWTWDRDGKLHVRSRGAMQYGGETDRTDPDDLFAKAIEHLLTVKPFGAGYVYRGEVIASPRHNVITYGRAPAGFIVLFDVEFPPVSTSRLPRITASNMARYLVDHAYHMEVETAWWFGVYTEAPSMDELDRLLDQESSLGGAKVEGVVFKNYGQIGPHDSKTPLFGKYVNEAFKEKKRRSDKASSQKSSIEAIGDLYHTEARWRKAVQHLAEAGELEGTPRDIGKLIGSVKRELWEDERDAIDAAYRKLFDRRLERIVAAGLPEWYKRELAKEGLA